MPIIIKDKYFSLQALMSHAEPMLLLQDVLHCDESHCRASVVIAEDSLFNQPSRGVPAYVGIEYMAQTIALWSGVQARVHGVNPKMGFLLGSRKYVAHCRYFTQGSALLVSTELIYMQDGLGAFSCRIHCDDALLASANVNVFEPEKQEDIFAQARAHIAING
jgi:predicted hotdog family 3-hydroxylacyl-ACP dehydratase